MSTWKDFDSQENSTIVKGAVSGFGWLCAALALPLLLVGNYVFAARYLLRLETPRDPFANIESHLTPIASPAVFAKGGPEFGSIDDVGRGTPIAQQFQAALGLTPGSFPETSEHLVPIDQVVRVNPYPQPLAVVYGRDVGFMSFGYVGTDEQYHQVTYYWGEADTTPSFLSRKVRGEATGWGDHYLRYTVFLSKRLKPRPSTYEMATGRITGWEQPPTHPDIDHVDWSTYRGPTYDGLEEIAFALVATCAEALVIAIWWRARRRRRLPAETTRLPGREASEVP